MTPEEFWTTSDDGDWRTIYVPALDDTGVVYKVEGTVSHHHRHLHWVSVAGTCVPSPVGDDSDFESDDIPIACEDISGVV